MRALQRSRSNASVGILDAWSCKYIRRVYLHPYIYFSVNALEGLSTTVSFYSLVIWVYKSYSYVVDWFWFLDKLIVLPHRYCECFASGIYCDGCSCVNCHNKKEYEDYRRESIEAILERKPDAFRSKIASSPNGAADGGVCNMTLWYVDVFCNWNLVLQFCSPCSFVVSIMLSLCIALFLFFLILFIT